MLTSYLPCLYTAAATTYGPTYLVAPSTSGRPMLCPAYAYHLVAPARQHLIGPESYQIESGFG